MESSRDDINSECEQQFEYEQRFRVDRKKLEMMMTNSPEFGEAAAEFFERIGAETDTCVIWPSRLKIGAKSKKDPHIRVGGQEEGVKRAKMLITEVLDTTRNSRVTPHLKKKREVAGKNAKTTEFGPQENAKIAKQFFLNDAGGGWKKIA